MKRIKGVIRGTKTQNERYTMQETDRVRDKRRETKLETDKEGDRQSNRPIKVGE